MRGRSLKKGQGTVTPYGVVYDNGMELKQIYNGRQFPGYLYGKDRIKLGAVTLMAGPNNADELRQLAEDLDQFDFVPGVQTPEEYGRYMIQESGHFEYDEHLEGFYDYRLYGEQRVRQEDGQFNECGYMAYHGTMTLDELMQDTSTEQRQREQGLQMGGLT